MKSSGERLDEILNNLIESAFMTETPSEYKIILENTKREIIEFFKECMPDEITWETDPEAKLVAEGFNSCKSETLKNIEEMGK